MNRPTTVRREEIDGSALGATTSQQLHPTTNARRTRKALVDIPALYRIPLRSRHTTDDPWIVNGWEGQSAPLCMGSVVASQRTNLASTNLSAATLGQEQRTSRTRSLHALLVGRFCVPHGVSETACGGAGCGNAVASPNGQSAPLSFFWQELIPAAALTAATSRFAAWSSQAIRSTLSVTGSGFWLGNSIHVRLTQG